MIVFFLDAPASLRSILSVSDTSPALGQCLRSSRLADIHQQDSHQHGQSSTSDNHQQQVHFSIDNHQHRTIINNHHWRSYQSGSLSLGGHNFLQFNIFYSILIFVPNIWESYQVGLSEGGEGTNSKMHVQFNILHSILIFLPNIWGSYQS